MKYCPTHGCTMVPSTTSYGIRYSCPASGCDVVCWDGETATPADLATRQMRMIAHAAFDEIWKSGQVKRQDAYNRLSEHLELPLKLTHIGMFEMDTLRRVVSFADKLPLVLLKEKWN